VLIGLGVGAQGVWKIAHRHDAEAIVAADITDAPGGQLEDAFHQLTGAKWLTYLVFAGDAAGLAVMARSPTHRPVVAMAVLLIALAIITMLVASAIQAVGARAVLDDPATCALAHDGRPARRVVADAPPRLASTNACLDRRGDAGGHVGLSDRARA
jgi:hypothetical protein